MSEIASGSMLEKSTRPDSTETSTSVSAKLRATVIT